jgi:uncharacterized protein (DUF1778 family)
MWRTDTGIYQLMRYPAMAVPQQSKQERLHIRIDTVSKQKLERAASSTHKTLSLSQNDWDVFIHALDNPPKPNDRLKKAFNLHSQHVR